MNTSNKISRVLGAAFLLQAVTSLTSGLPLKLALTVPGNIGETMTRIANNALLMRANIFGETITACGIIFLGAVLYIGLRKQNEIMALVGMGLYLLEAALGAASRVEAFSLLRISQEYVTAGPSAYLMTMGNLAYESMRFEYQLAMLAFCAGALLFYPLLDKARIVPRVLSLWGVITLFPVLAATITAIFGLELPFFVYLPYVPFEFAIGIWILIKGVRLDTGAKPSFA